MCVRVVYEVECSERRSGEAWWVYGDPNRPWDEHFGEFKISGQLYWSLFKLGIIDFFRTLPNDGYIDDYEEGTLFRAGLSEAVRFVRERAQGLRKDRYVWASYIELSFRPLGVTVHRVVVDRETLRSELNAFAEFLSEGERLGFDVQLCL